ncbi:kelch-like protein 10 [Plakobranchus ocellatus]|uniref:Kelch-like protein 10 n=1 Tax=Plakobranchus ocellatus TaxID=259542 RepID=A0AAV3ZAV0_9GAST|nr:kelch-like protein 10 [Plakobranchus ocellatus]
MALIDIEEVDLESGGDGCYRGDTIFGILAELRQAGKFCDAVLKVKNQSYPIHRNIMSACSPYFKSLFTSHAFRSGDSSGRAFGYHVRGPKFEEKSVLRQIFIARLSPPSAKWSARFFSDPAKIKSVGNVKNGTNLIMCTEKREVSIPGLPAEAARQVIDFAYTRTAKLSPENVELLTTVADQFHVHGLLKLCCEYLHKNLTHTNCIGILLFALLCYILSSDQLNVSCEEFVFDAVCRWVDYCPNFRKIHMRRLLATVRLGLLPALVFEEKVKSHRHILNNVEVRPLIADTETFLADQLNVSCEEFVFDAVCRWVDYCPNFRKIHMRRLLATVRLGLLPALVFEEKVKSHRHILNNVEVRPLIADTETFLAELDKSEEPDFDMSLPFARPRVPHEILFVIGGWSGGRPIKMVETYDTRADRWVVCKSEDTTPRAYHGVVAIGCIIYVVGGFDATECFNNCRAFDTRTKTWSEVAPMNIKRSYVSVALLDGFIYAMGGFEGPPRNPSGVINSPRLRSAERFNPSTNQWTLIANMRERRSDASATSLNGEIYICGGFNGSECLCSAEVYNPVSDQWTLIPPMSSRRSGVGVISYNGAIYAVGGFDGVSRTSTAERYSPSDRAWSNLPEMYNARSNFGIEVIDDMLFVIGGFNGETTIYNVECYDTQAGEWYNATDMNLYKSALSACVVRDLPDVRDYVYKKGDNSTSVQQRQVTIVTADAAVATSSSRTATTNTSPVNASSAGPLTSRLFTSAFTSLGGVAHGARNNSADDVHLTPSHVLESRSSSSTSSSALPSRSASCSSASTQT